MKSNLRRSLKSLVGLLILLGFISPPPAFSCEQSWWPHGQNIVVQAGTISDAIRTGCGADTILVEEGAQVVSQGIDVVGVDSDGGQDSVTNEGNIFVAATEVQGEKDVSCGSRRGIHWKHSCFSADADATAMGIQTGNGQDSVLNTGSIEVTASTQLTDSGTARSLAIGIDSGNGSDSSENSDSAVASGSGSIEVSAVSTASLSGETWELAGRHAADRSVDTEATAIGILGGNGKDSVTNDATLTVGAQSGITLAESSATLLEVHEADLSLHSGALAVGIDGGNGKDQITNQGELSVAATSTIETGSLTVTGIDTDRTDFDGSSTAIAKAVGISTGNSGNESVDIGNSSTITVQATSSINADSIALTLADMASSTDTSLTSIANASGIVGGHGKDVISNEGTLTVGASASVDSLALELSLLDMGSADTSLLSSAAAVGIAGGQGKDTIVNGGDISVTAESSAKSNGLAVTGVSGLPGVRDAGFNGSTTATAAATGISTGSSCDEALGIGNASSITVQATSSVDAGSYSLTLLADLASSVDTSLTSIADASGIVGGHGQDTIANEGTLTVGASADIDSISVELNLLDVAKAAADLDAWASAVGIDSGTGNDSILNSGTISAGATANTESWSAEFSAVDIATADFSSSTTAEAVGVASGQGMDTITNTGSITAEATAETLMGDFSMSLIDLTPLAELDFLGLDTPGDGSTTVEAEATGVSSGCQDDSITSSGSITAKATTEATRIGVEVGAEGLPGGLFNGEIAGLENLASADVSVSSKATGIDAGAGDDEITNQGSVTADASATSWGGSLSLSLPLVELPFPSPFPAFSLVDAGTEANAEATGIQGGEGDELVRNEGDLDIDASASALNVAASIGFQGSIDDIAVAATRVDAMTEAKATASGIEGGEGDERILSSGDVTVDAVAETLAVGANVAVQNKAEPKYLVDVQGTLADVRSTTAAEASGILGGEGQDAITSSGDITVSADSRNAGVGLSASVISKAEKGLVMDGAVVKADSTATAEAVGIDGGEGEDAIRNSGSVAVSAEAETLSAAVALTYQGSSSKALGLQAALATVTTTSEANAEGLSGGTENDLIVNEGALNVSADSLAIAASVAVDIMPGKSPGLGIALANAQNQATSEATGIDGGEGNDLITNSGAVTVDADATGIAASISVTRQGAAGSGILDPATFDAGNSAAATAKGIDGGEGDETITNSGDLNVSSTAVAPSVGVAVTTSKGISAAITTAEASSSSTGIDTGEGTHWIHNAGAITADSTAVAAGVSVSVSGEGLAASIDTVWDGGTTATADAAGIRAQGGNDHIENEAAISASSTAVAPSVDVAVTGKGVSVGISTATSTASSVGIEAGAGDDQVLNSGAISSTAYANADAISVDISGKGVAGSGNDVWDGGVEASALARGIDAGAGSNTVVNTGSIAADATATTVSAGVSIVGKGLSASVSTATATAEAVGIDPGETTPELWNSGDITSTATATAVTVNADIAGKGAAAALDEVWDGGTQATATARGIEAGAVNNTIWNEGAITAGSEATAPSVGVAIAGKGLSAAVTTSTATADSIGIDTREGDDVVANSGAISATADAEAYAISVAVTGKGVAVAGDAVWDGGTTALARAAGIDTGSGNDVISSAGDILADSSATTVAAGVSVAGEGITAAVSTSTADAQALGIAAGAGADWIESVGDITVDASSTAVTANVAVTGKGIAGAADAVWDGGTHSTAVAKAIDAGSGIEDDSILSQGDLTATSDATTVAVSAAITGKGISLATTTSTTTAQAVGIEAGAGNDTIQSEGTILADSSATGVTVAASITGTGISGAADAVWDGGTHTTALAAGIDAGNGDDRIASVGDITANSTAVTVGVDAAITGTGLSLAATTSTTVAQAVGINAGAGTDAIQSQGAITADASATGVAVAASITGTGVSGAADAVWDGGTHTTALATGIAAGEGDDSIASVGGITATSDAVTVAVDAAITGTGLSLATSTATTTAQAVGIEAGTGNDVIQSEGDITADSSATGVAVAASITGTGVSGAADAVWDGGTHSTAVSTGINAGEGDDSILSAGDITATSDAVTVAADVAITGTGVSLATSTATTAAQAVGIDAGGGNDTIHSEGIITADASSTGIAVAASITGIGVSGSTDAVWDGGTDTSAVATGIQAGDGDDALHIGGSILATADATTVAVDAAITGKGVSLAATASNTTATAVGIDGGAGSDLIDNSAGITSSASASGVGVAAGLTGLGLSGATDAVWDSGTAATTAAVGIDGGTGDDTITNTGNILLTSDADTVAVDVALTGAGVSAALTNTTVEARAVGIDGDEGDDTILNLGAISGTSTADAVGVGVSITGAGVSASATDVWEDGISGQASFVGIDAGSGNDRVTNSGAITGTSTTTTPAVSVSVSGIGIGAAANTASAAASATGIHGGAGDDLINNSGAISVASTADANTVIVSLTGVGASVGIDSIWDGGTTATAAATGIGGGEGSDLIANSAAIGASATADTAATGVTMTLAGASASLVNSTASALAVGIDGGEGNDTISNSGAITAAASADADTVAVSVSGVGASFGGDQWSEDTLASAAAIGIDGGVGNDAIQNTGAITATSTSDSDATAVTVTLAGYADSEAENTSASLAEGISGGEGDDTIGNSGSIVLTSSATAEAGSVTVNLAGASPAEAGTTAMAVGTGIDGGAGADSISNSGAIAATVTASTDASSTNVTLLGYGDSSAESTSVADATGIRGGDGDDQILNYSTGSITLQSTATAAAGGVQVGLAGAFGGEAGTTAAATATAIDGGAGNDTIRNEAQVSVTATTSTSADNTSVGIFGTSEADVNTVATTIAQGIAGGDGTDWIENTGNLSVTSSATTSLDSYSFDFGGSSSGEGTLTANSSAVGISGGEGSDQIDNSGQIHATATSTMTVAGDSDVAFGSASAGADTSAATAAVGIDAGQGDDTVTSWNTITVDALTTMTLDSSSFSFGGKAASGEGAMSASTRGAGIAGGDGSDAITSEAAITVRPKTTLSALSGSDVAFGSANAGTSITADTQAVGIDAGAGDDTVANRGGIVVGYYNSDATDAMTEIDVSGSTWSFGGTGSINAAALAETSSVGIDGGRGDDNLSNEAGLEVNGTAYAKTSGGTYTFAGSSASSGVVTAETEVVGVEAGEGDDEVTNSAAITVRARSRADSTGSTETTFGSSSAYAGASSSASAKGVDGQDGDEVIENTGSVLVSADAYTYGSTNSNVFAGSPSADSVTSATAVAFGVDAGAGDNSIDNRGLIQTVATANADPDATADSDIMSNRAGSSAASSATAEGISAGEGSDTITNHETGQIIATANAIVTPYSHSDESSSSAAYAWATARGIQAGDGANTVLNLGSIQAAAGATVDATGVSRSLTNYAKSTAQAYAVLRAEGIATGLGNDLITNGSSGTVAASATVTGIASATPRPNEGEHNEGSSATIGLTAQALGIYSGSGTDAIANQGQLSAAATAGATAYSKSNTDITSNASAADATASANAFGISAGGGGADTILNDQGAGITATATSTASTSADSDENSSATGASNAIALGIWGADADSSITNLSSIQATSGATIAATTVAASHTDTAHSTSSPTANAQAQGILSSQGNDLIANGEDGQIWVRATAIGSALATYDDTHLDHANALVSSTATASGICSGNGDNSISNLGLIDVNALGQANADARADTDMAENWGTADSTLSATAYGILAGTGSDMILNELGASITAKASAATTLGAPTGVSSFARSDEHATASASFQAKAWGIEAGDGDNTISNLGAIEAVSQAAPTACTIASSNTMTAYSIAGVTATAEALGITAGLGNDSIANGEQGLIKASATATGSALGTYFAEHMDIAGATAIASATASGIAAGAGDNTIENRGSIDVDALAQAYAVSRASTSTADTYSAAISASTATASGISAAGGNNVIENHGLIDVRAEAQASADAYAHTDWWGDEHTYMSATRTARAYGIQALDGSNTIINNGTINSTAIGSDVQAYGIQTGGGDDLIVNNGTITTLRVIDGLPYPGTPIASMLAGSKGSSSSEGVGIDTGAGNDQVVLGDGSYIGCTLDLGEGNDGLTVIGSGTISGNVYAGLGSDRLTLDGATNFNLDQTFDFEGLLKLGSSTVNLNNAQMLQQLDVFAGILQINNGYQFTDAGAFSAKVYGGGSCGQLLVSGGLGLDGTMTVVRGPGAYLDGATYEVLTADNLSGSFDSIVLPGSTPLLSFALADGGSNSYRVTASTEAFGKVATTSNERAITGCLDSIVASAQGDLSLVLGEIQAMQPKGYSTAFASLSPESYAGSTRSTLSAADQFSQVLSNRLRSLRPLSTGRSDGDGLRPPLERMAYGSSSGRSDDPERMADYGLWVSGFGQWGGFASADGYTGFDFNLYGSTLGYDRYLGRGLTAGASLGYANTQLYYKGGTGAGLSNSVNGSAYGSYARGPLHLDAALSYGRQSYENSRIVEVGSIERTAASEHGSNALQACLGGGLTLGRRPWTIEPLASAQYVYLNEEGFTEQGAGGVSLNVQERTAHSLVSDLGLRLGLYLDFGRRALASELFAAWRHDFAQDLGTITASFVDAPDTLFTVSGPETERNGVLLGASLLFRDNGRFSAGVKYNLELRGGYRANSLSGEVQYGF